MRQSAKNFIFLGLFALIVIAASALAAEPIRLIVRGDDMGISYDVNKAFIKAHKEGILTAASVMVPGQYFDEAVALCKENPKLSVGIHITLTAVDPLKPMLPPEEIPSLVASDGFFLTPDAYSQTKPKPEDIEKEARSQILKARAAGLHFVYLDAHILGKLTDPVLKEIIVKLAKEQNLLVSPLEGEKCMGFGDLAWTKPFCYPHYPTFTQKGENNFYQKLENLTPGLWINWFHPGLASPAQTRVTDLLCSAKAKEIIKKRGIQLIGYQELRDKKFATNDCSK